MTNVRPVTEAMAVALTSNAPRILLAQIEHPSGTSRFFTGIGRKTWNGYTWVGSGSLGSVSPLKQSSEIATQDIVFRLSGVDADLVAKLNEDVRNRSGFAWLACLDSRGKIVSEPYKMIDSELDTQGITFEDDGTATIEIVAHAGFYSLNRGIEEVWSTENQRLRYPTDTGMDMIPSLAKQDLQWTPS